jgi:hypothetical protein
MSAYYIILGVIVGVLVAGFLPWLLLRNLKGDERENGES